MALWVTHALEGEALPVYCGGLKVRDWIDVEDQCQGLDGGLRKGDLARSATSAGTQWGPKWLW